MERRSRITIISIALTVAAIFLTNTLTESREMTDKTVYDFKAETIDGKEISLEKYKGKVLLIVNVASECGYTPQYEGLQELYEKYNDKGLEILGFPCNQFGGQEPGSEEEIKDFCKTKFSVTFPLFSKIKVNGDNAHPLYKYLRSEQSGLIVDDIKWNFTKFLIDKNGKPIDRFATQTTPEDIEEDVKKALDG